MSITCNADSMGYLELGGCLFGALVVNILVAVVVVMGLYGISCGALWTTRTVRAWRRKQR